MTTFHSNEIVDITIKGARIMPPKPGDDDTLTLAYEQVQPGVFATISLRHPEARSVTIERVAPAAWPPVEGDVWGDSEGARWFAHWSRRTSASAGELRLTPAGAELSTSGAWWPERLLDERGPLELIHRERRAEPDGDAR